MLKALHTVVFHFLVRPGHLDISAMWRLWINVCHECQSIAFISEIPFVRPMGMLLQFHAGYERASEWQTIDFWILMEKWPSSGGIHQPGVLSWYISCQKCTAFKNQLVLLCKTWIKGNVIICYLFFLTYTQMEIQYIRFLQYIYVDTVYSVF